MREIGRPKVGFQTCSFSAVPFLSIFLNTAFFRALLIMYLDEKGVFGRTGEGSRHCGQV